MGKIEFNKQQKLNSILDAALELFTTKGVTNTSIAEISQKSGIAKGTFYLYFKDKYDIRNHLISHESSKLFREAAAALEKEKQMPDYNGEYEKTEEQIIFIVNNIIDKLNSNQILLIFISKNLSWGIFREAISANLSSDEVNFKEVCFNMLNSDDREFVDPEIMLYMITELVSSTSYSAILYKDPVDLESIKPYLFDTIRFIIANHVKKQV
ncbi:MAG: TetR/AcrR family transcriptional regulator [Lachnospiraceae bacterium]|nr:TetR/AcrR family transcriptional regulator [Lachnospiraceae bacterium]